MSERPRMEPPTTAWGFWRPVVLWAALALVVFGFCMLTYVGIEKNRAHMNNQAQEEKASSEMVLMGRYCLGAKSVYSGWLAMETDAVSEGLLLHLKRSVRDPSGQVGLVPFIAELASREAVFPYIDALRNTVDLTAALTSDLDQFEMLYRLGATGLSAEIQQRLVMRYRWIAQMALTTGLPADHPDRAVAMKQARRTFFTALLVFGIISLGGFTGCVFFVIAIVLLIKKRMRFGFDLALTSEPMTRYVFLESTVLFLAMTLLMSVLGRYLYTPVAWILTIAIAAISISWPVWRGMRIASMRRAIGWHNGNGLIREMGAGLMGYLAGLPLMACGILATYFISQYTGANPAHPIVEQFENASMQKMIGILVLACVMAPLIEETIFRGALYTHLRLKHSAIWSVLITSLIFAIIHPQGLAALPALGAIAVVLAILREWRGSLIAPMTAHAFNNFLATMVLAFALWG